MARPGRAPPEGSDLTKSRFGRLSEAQYLTNLYLLLTTTLLLSYTLQLLGRVTLVRREGLWNYFEEPGLSNVGLKARRVTASSSQPMEANRYSCTMRVYLRTQKQSLSRRVCGLLTK
jgi:hypothetical protein